MPHTRLLNTVRAAVRSGLALQWVPLTLVAGVVGITKSVAVEYAARGIRMNCINPAGCDTEMVREFIKSSPDPGAMEATLGSLTPVPGIIDPDVVGDAAVYLCSPTNRWLTGVAMPIDGGYLAGHSPFHTLDRWEKDA